MNRQYPLADKAERTSLALKWAVCAGLEHGRSGRRTEELVSYARGKDGGTEVAEGRRVPGESRAGALTRVVCTALCGPANTEFFMTAAVRTVNPTVYTAFGRKEGHLQGQSNLGKDRKGREGWRKRVRKQRPLQRCFQEKSEWKSKKKKKQNMETGGG